MPAARPATPPPPVAPPAEFPPGLADKFTKLGITRRSDLLLHLPLRYEDRTRLTPLAALRAGDSVLTEGVVIAVEVTFKPRRQLRAVIEQGSRALQLRFFHFYPNQQKTLENAKEQQLRVRVFGEVRFGFQGLEMVHPQVQAADEDTPVEEALTPVYPTTAGLSQEVIRRSVRRELLHATHPALRDVLPPTLRESLTLWPYADAIRTLHQPPPDTALQVLDDRTHPAWHRLKFDEMLAQQLCLRRHYRQKRAERSPALVGNATLVPRLLASLPFGLTGAQARVVDEINTDLSGERPMQRLLQGDVGSGKTIVAALAALRCIEAGWQAVLMAPTEILAEQHYRKLSGWLEPLGIRVGWLAGGPANRKKAAAVEAIAAGEVDLAIGTHALFQDDIAFPRLGLAIVDEQHRFGVAQRLALRKKGGLLAANDGGHGLVPHQLMMSATPIPRTLSMTYYADLDVSVIDELPPGRTPVVTKLVSQARRDEVIARVQRACALGRQVYWVCPLIEESEKLQLQTAEATYQDLQAALPELSIGLLHGRLKADEKATVMAGLVQGEVQVLVATTVIEVGVDVPNACLMVIEHAERFGLAQLHQLRGRVGRGAAESVCILLFGDPLSETARARLKVIYEQTDGFEIARQDLAIRGPGEFLGARQSGVPMLRFADLERDADLIPQARKVADELLRHHPAAAQAYLERWMAGKEEFIKA